MSQYDLSRGGNDDIPSVRLHDVSGKSQMKHQRRLSGTSPRLFSGTYPRRPISTSLRRLMLVPNETSNNVAVARLYHISEIRCYDVLSLLRYYVFKLLWHHFHLIGFQVSFIHQTKHLFSSTNQKWNKRSSLGYKLVEILLYLRAFTCMTNISNISNSCVDI